MKNPTNLLSSLLFFFLSLSLFQRSVYAQNAKSMIDVGVILDFDSWVGKMSRSCMSMALSDFYAVNPNYRTRLVLHTRDSKRDAVDATSAAIDLLKNVQVQAILGPMRSWQAEFVVEIGNKTRVPIISFSATSPFLSTIQTPYFVRTGLNDSSQVKAIAAMVQAFEWREVVPIYENTEYGSGIVPYLTDAFHEINTDIPYRSAISTLATDDQILEELYKLMTMQTRVFVVHMTGTLASRLFLKAKEVGMMSKGYAWIITDGLANMLPSMDSSVIHSMQGVLGVKPYIPRSNELINFTTRWRRKFRQENPEIDRIELNVFGLWAYDSIWALAMATESTGVVRAQFEKPLSRDNLTDLAAIGISKTGPKLLEAILRTSFKGLSGEFQLVDGELQSSAFKIINVIGKGEREIGFWTPAHGVSEKLNPNDKKMYSASRFDLQPIIWPGDLTEVPKGWEIPTSERKLRIGVPVKDGFREFVKVDRDPHTYAPIVTGFCIDVFKAVMESLPYAVPYEFIPFDKPDGQSAGNYNDLVYQVFLHKFDAVVGDTTILANRSLHVDFTLPFTESGVSMIVPIKDDERKNAWIFLKPLTMELWVTTGAFFIFTGFVVWLIEHRINIDFRGSPSKQAGMVFWFSFSTLVFAHKEKVISNLSRFVVIIWIFVVLVLTSSYTASLTSMLTVQQLLPTITDIKDLIRNGDYVGYQRGSFVTALTKKLQFDESKLKIFNTFEEYDEALSRGSRRGGVAAIIDEIPYIKLFLTKYCSKYTMVGPTYKTAGFGFAFPKGSPLVPDISRAILNVTEGDKMVAIERAWFGPQADCQEQGGTTVTSDSLTLDSFKGLFLIAGVSSCTALFIFLFIFLYEHRDILASKDSLQVKIAALAKLFDEKKDLSSHSSKKKKIPNEGIAIGVAIDEIPPNSSTPLSPAMSIFHHEEGLFPHEGLSSPELGTPNGDPLANTEISEERC